MSKPRIGLKDIAQETGVSSAAVSLVLNNRPGVSNATRQRVNDAARKLGYRPRRSRLSKLTPREATKLGSIGFKAFGVNAALGHSYYGDILSGASAAARELGASLAFEAYDEPGLDGLQLPTPTSDGVLITGRPPRDYVMRLHERRVPYVLVCCSLAHFPGDTIGPENVESSYHVVQHLARLGHRRIAYLGGEPNNADARERYLGYRWAIDDLGLDADDSLALMSFFDTEHGACGLKQLYEQAGEFTAIYAASDFLAMGVYQSARDLGVSIPDQLTVVGFDNNSLCETLHPRLTTMGLDRERIGRLSVRRLAEIVDHPQAPMSIRLPAELIERDSCTSIDP